MDRILSIEDNSTDVLERQVWKSWKATADPDGERCQVHALLKHRNGLPAYGAGDIYLLWGLRCGTWRCPFCGPALKRNWLGHLQVLLGQETSAYLTVREADSWPALRRKLNRGGGKYVKVKLLEGKLAILTTMPLGEVLPHSIRAGVLGAAIDAAPFEKGAVSTSRSWSMKAHRGESLWAKVGATRLQGDRLEEHLARLGVENPWIPFALPSGLSLEFMASYLEVVPTKRGPLDDGVDMVVLKEASK